MRLTSKELKNINTVFEKYRQSLDDKLYLFGSRTKQNKKGGDIDLLLLTTSNFFSFYLEKKAFIKYDLEFELGEQRVDLTIATNNMLTKDVFLQSIKEDLIEI